MNQYVIIADKEYFECTYNQLIEQLGICIKFYENIDIDPTPDPIIDTSRQNNLIGKFDVNKVMKIYFENTNGLMYDKSESESDYDSDYDSNHKSDTDDLSDNEDNQIGGADIESMKFKYLKYKLKYLILLDEMR